jgi:hypothetical protein
VDGKSKSFLFLPSKGEKNKKQMGFGWFKWWARLIEKDIYIYIGRGRQKAKSPIAYLIDQNRHFEW